MKLGFYGPVSQSKMLGCDVILFASIWDRVEVRENLWQRSALLISISISINILVIVLFLSQEAS